MTIIAPLLFLSVLVLTCYLEAKSLLLRLLGREARFRKADWILHTVAGAGLLCILYGRLIEPTWIEVRTHELRSAKIRPESGRIRVVQLADLHSEGSPLNEERVPAMVSALQPDIIALTGDYVNGTAGLPVFEKMVRQLKAPAGIFVVQGNYDWGMRELHELTRNLPVTWLSQDTREVEVRGTRLRLMGLDVGNEPSFRSLAASGGKGAFNLLLFHYSDLAYEAEAAGVDLYLSGHTHGGQVRLPFYGALVTLARFGKRFEGGLYRLGATTLYVSRGLGVEGGLAPRVRFLCRPEIAVFDLLPIKPQQTATSS